MAEEKNHEDLSVDEIDKEISQRMGFLIESNAKFINTSREMASDMLQCAGAYEAMAQVCREVAELHAIGARKVADLTGDLVTTEWGITVVEDDEECDTDDDTDDCD